MSEGQKFRANIGIVVLNNRWDVLALERVDEKASENGEMKGTGQWQMPQGGLDEGEEPEEAWKRELREEININPEDVEFIDSYLDWLVYELPKEVREDPKVKAKHGRGQAQKWFFVRLIDPSKIRLEPDDPASEQEFADYKWIQLASLAEETWEVRKPIYLKLSSYLEKLKSGEISK